MIKEGATDGEIKEFMVARYGRFVLYNPPLDKQTIFLWLGPVGLLILGGVLVLLRIRRSTKALDHRDSQ